MLPEIDAAVRASVISPAEDAKEKLGKLSRVVIDVRDEDSYKIEIQLEPTGSLSMDELKQAFQLLDMSITDDNEESIKVNNKYICLYNFVLIFIFILIDEKISGIDSSLSRSLCCSLQLRFHHVPLAVEKDDYVGEAGR